MVLKSRFLPLAFAEKSLGLYLLERIKKYGDAVALVDPTNDLQITFRQVKQQSLDFASKLLSLGLEKGDVVGLIAPFKPQFIPLMIGIALAKGVVSFYNILHKPDEILNQLSSDGSSICIVDESSANITVDELKRSKILEKGIFTFADILKRDLQNDDLDVDLTSNDVDLHNDPLFVYYTSGTTGKPKGVVKTNYAHMATAELSGFMANKSSSIPLVLATVAVQLHALSVTTSINYLINGYKHVILSSITPDEFDRYVRSYNINGIALANAYCFSKIVEEVPATGDSLKFIAIGGMKFPIQLVEQARTKFGIAVVNGWGCTETDLISGSRTASTPVTSCGKLVDNVSLKVIDVISGKELGPNGHGELCVKGPRLFKGYFKPPNDISDVKDADGWFHTGDFGYYDDQGFIYILDRIKDVIKSENSISIFPSELEAVLMSHPSVADAAVIRVEHPVYVEAPKAFIVKKDPKLTRDELLSYFNERVAKFKMLHGGLEFIEVIPRSGIGKTMKSALV